MSRVDVDLAAWECVCALRVSRDHAGMPTVREAMVLRALDHADRAWAAHVKDIEESQAKAAEVAP